MAKYSTYSDAQLIGLLKHDDELAFNEVYERYWNKLLSVSYHRTGDMYAAKEIVQVIFIHFWNKRQNLHIQFSLATYFSAAVKYEVINFLAAAKRREKATIKAFRNGSSVTYAYDQDYNELQRTINLLVNALPEQCKVIYQLSRDYRMKNKDIAKSLNLSEKTVENQITIALRKLKSGLSTSAIIIFSFFWG